MTREKMRNLLKDAFLDITFAYHGKYAIIMPRAQNKFDVGFGNTSATYTTINDLMNDPIYDGKTLNEIAEDISELEMI